MYAFQYSKKWNVCFIVEAPRFFFDYINADVHAR